MTKLAEYQKRRYMDLKDRGICVRCGLSNARPGKTMCVECAEKNLERVKQIRATWRTTGRCIRCGKPFFSKEGHTSCDACLEGIRKAEKQLYHDRKKENLCPVCGKQPPEEGRQACRSCLDYVNNNAKKYYHRHKAEAAR